MWTITNLNYFIENHTKGKAIIGHGPDHPVIMFVKQNPGPYEVIHRMPFPESSLQKIKEAVEACDLEMKEIYLTNAIKVIPADGNFPNWSEVYFWKWDLTSEIKLVKPQNIIALGTATAKWLGHKSALTLPDPGSITFNDNKIAKLIRFIKYGEQS
jgi:uracil-DNA glycosylase family 4